MMCIRWCYRFYSNNQNDVSAFLFMTKFTLVAFSLSQVCLMSESGCCGSGCDPCVLDLPNLGQADPSEQDNCLRPDYYRPFTVSQVELIGESVLLISWRCDGVGCSLQAEPGQHVILRAPAQPPFFSRPYTLLPAQGCWRTGAGPSALVRLRADGRMSSYLRTLRAGDTSHLRGPFGAFRLPCPPPPLLLVGAGVGVAPLLALASAALAGDAPVRLLLSVARLREVPLRAALAELACAWNFTLALFVGCADVAPFVREQVVEGRIGRERLEAELGAGRGRGVLVAVCGGEGFVRGIRAHLAALRHEASVHVF